MNGGGGNDLIDGGGGADQLTGDTGDDTFVYRSGDAVSGENIFGGIGNDAILAIGAAVSGDLFQTGGVNISSINTSSVETVFLNGTEVVINAAQLGLGGLETFVGLSGARDQLTVGNVTNADLSTLNLTNWEAQDTVAITGTAGVDVVTGTAYDDIFLGLQGADTFNGGNGDDRFLILADDLTPMDSLTGGAGTDVLQVDSTAIATTQVHAISDLRNLTLNGIETLDVVKGSFILDGADFVGAISGPPASLAVSTVGFDRVIGNGDGAGPTIALLEIQMGNLLGLNLGGLVFENWNDGFYIDKLVRIVAGAQTLAIVCPNEETLVNATAATGNLSIKGGTGADQIYGSNYRDIVQSGAGDDYVYTLSGNDVIELGSGNDTLWADDGDDTMSGGDGADFLFGGSGVDWLLGNDGNDTLDGELGTDYIWGGLGADVHIGGDDAGTDFARYDDANYGNLMIRLDNSALNTGAAAVGDTYVGIEGLAGGAGNDTVYGDGLANTLYGLGGNDAVYGEAGNDQIFGGDGNDFIGGGGNNDTIRGDAGADTIYGGLGNDDIGGGYGNDLIYGSAGSNVIYGGLGNDTVQGGSGADTIYGSVGKNQLFGNDGIDSIFTSAGGDFVGGGAGNDSIRGDLGADTIYGGTGNDNIGGGAGNDLIFGSAGANSIWGGAGNDTVHGGTGKDVVSGGLGADVFVFASAAVIGIGAARDIISDFTHGQDDIDLRALGAMFTGAAGLSGGGAKSFYYFAAGGLLIGDQNGDGLADWALELTGAPTVTASDFLL